MQRASRERGAGPGTSSASTPTVARGAPERLAERGAQPLRERDAARVPQRPLDVLDARPGEYARADQARGSASGGRERPRVDERQDLAPRGGRAPRRAASRARPPACRPWRRRGRAAARRRARSTRSTTRPSVGSSRDDRDLRVERRLAGRAEDRGEVHRDDRRAPAQERAEHVRRGAGERRRRDEPHHLRHAAHGEEPAAPRRPRRGGGAPAACRRRARGARAARGRAPPRAGAPRRRARARGRTPPVAVLLGSKLASRHRAG